MNSARLSRPARLVARLALPLLAMTGCSGSIEGESGSASTGPGSRSPGPVSGGAGAAGDQSATNAGGVTTGTSAAGAPVASLGLSCTAPVLPSGARLWLLTSAQYGRTVATLFSGRSSLANTDGPPPAGITLPLAEAAAPVKFSNIAVERRLTPPRVESLIAAADELATRLLADPSVAPCVQGGALRDCLTRVVKDKGELLFRRPLTADEIARYIEAGAGVENEGRGAAVRTMLRVLLLAPQFILRWEIGTAKEGGSRLVPFEIASALSYGLTEGPPDQPLWDEAQRGTLGDRAVIERHVTRLLANLPASAGTMRFARELFRYTETLEIERTAPFHKPVQLVKEADQLLASILGTNGHKDLLRTLLTARTGVLSPATAPSYTTKITAGASATPVPYTFEGERQGLLGHPAWLSSYAQPERNDPIVRGRFVQEHLLCNTLPDAPIEGLAPLSEDPRIPLREKLVAHLANPSCRSCHAMMDDIGLALEGFDHFGRQREVDAGKPIIRDGHLRGSGDQDGPFRGLEGLATKLASSSRALGCFVSNAFEAFMGRPPGAGDSCVLEDARRRYLSSGGDFTALVQALYQSDAFLNRVRDR